ncbi:MAG: ATP-dependent Clp protease proteolytic subunit [Planctomycetota bacterium]
MAEPEQIRVTTFVEKQLDRLAGEIEQRLSSHVMAIVGPIYPGVDDAVRQAVEARPPAPAKEKTVTSPATSQKSLALVIDTPGGIIEVVERIVNIVRHHYDDVTMIVPNRAMSAGTIFAMSGDRIMMDYFSCLGPIDPQIERNGKLVPALSYLVQFERLKKKSEDGTLTTAEVILLQQLDLAELHSFEAARELTNSLLKEWLAKYKFKDWTETETRKIQVTPELRQTRALEVAQVLMDHQRWHSHGRPLSMEVLRRDAGLRIDDYGVQPELSRSIKDYYQFLADYMTKIGVFGVVHGSGFFQGLFLK